LDPETINTIVKLIAPLAEELINSILENTSKLDELLQKVDQVFLRDIKSGFEALGDGLESKNAETRRLRLEFAEKVLLNNTTLQPGFTGGSSNEYLMAQCHYGLSIIASQRADDDLAARHVLRAFAVDPYSARTEFFPKVFTEVFDPKCADIYEWNKAELDRLDREPFRKEIMLEKAGYSGAMALGVAGGILGFFAKGPAQGAVIRSATQGIKTAYQNMEKVGPEKFRTRAKAQQGAVFQERLNERCRELAKAGLAGGAHAAARAS
jgi:hypothetical protein